MVRVGTELYVCLASNQSRAWARILSRIAVGIGDSVCLGSWEDERVVTNPDWQGVGDYLNWHSSKLGMSFTEEGVNVTQAGTAALPHMGSPLSVGACIPA